MREHSMKFAWLVSLAALATLLLAMVVPTVSAATPTATNSCDPYVPLETNSHVCCPAGTQNNATECFMSKYLGPVVQGLSVLAGIAVVVGIIMGGIQYASAAGDPQKTAKGKSTITKALVGLVSYLFLFGALQFLSPGGLATQSGPTGPGSTIAEKCSKTFLGIQPWYRYLPDKDANGNETFAKIDGKQTCTVQNFTLLGEGNDLGRVILAIADGLVKIAAIVAVAFIIVGGFQFVTSQGEPDRAKRARETILNAVIGLIIAIIAVAVVSFIGNQLSS